MMVSRLDIASASSMECVVKRTADWAPSFFIAAEMNYREAGSTPVVASSIRIIFGFPSIARAVQSLRLLPPLRAGHLVFSKGFSANSSKYRSTILEMF